MINKYESKNLNALFDKKVSEQAKAVLRILNENGFEAYIVGGSVRDIILGKEPKDFDIATNALPYQVKKLFEKTVDTGIKHGTVTVIYDKASIEVTAYRVDGEYSDNRHPDNVKFTSSLKEDLSRRDFTVNALCYNEREGLCDLFGGLEDIDLKLIRCVGNADKRFNEDALRILRGIRFASQLGFEIEKSTSDSIRKNKHLIKKVSSERIREEFLKLLCGENAREVLMHYSDVISQFIPEVSDMVGFSQNNPYHKYDVYEHIVRCVGFAKANVNLKLAAFFHDIGKPYCYTEKDGVGHFYSHPHISEQIARDTLTRLRFDNKTIHTVCTLVKYHDIMISPEEKRIRRLLNKFGEDTVRLLFKLKRADNMAKGVPLGDRLSVIDRSEEILDDIIKKDLCFSLKQLNINGNDLKSIGFEGKQIGLTLDILLREVINGTCQNTYTALCDKAIGLKNKNTF